MIAAFCENASKSLVNARWMKLVNIWSTGMMKEL